MQFMDFLAQSRWQTSRAHRRRGPHCVLMELSLEKLAAALGELTLDQRNIRPWFCTVDCYFLRHAKSRLETQLRPLQLAVNVMLQPQQQKARRTMMPRLWRADQSAVRAGIQAAESPLEAWFDAAASQAPRDAQWPV